MPEAFKEIQLHLEKLKEQKSRLLKSSLDTTAVEFEISEIKKILQEFERQGITIEEQQ